MNRSKADVLKDIDKIIKGYERIQNPNESVRFCLGKVYKMYWLLLEAREILKTGDKLND